MSRFHWERFQSIEDFLLGVNFIGNSRELMDMFPCRCRCYDKYMVLILKLSAEGGCSKYTCRLFYCS